MSRIIALDTETTGLDPKSEEIFEIACVDVHSKQEWVWTIEPPPSAIEAMHPKAAEVNRYHERTEADDWKWTLSWDDQLHDNNASYGVLNEISSVLTGAHILGAVPDFDTRFLTAMYATFDVDPPRWHYHLIDVEVLAVGWLKHEKDELIDRGGVNDLRHANEIHDALSLPYDSDELARLCGILPPAEDERHTALGDARWVARWYRQIMQE